MAGRRSTRGSAATAASAAAGGKKAARAVKEEEELEEVVVEATGGGKGKGAKAANGKRKAPAAAAAAAKGKGGAGAKKGAAASSSRKAKKELEEEEDEEDEEEEEEEEESSEEEEDDESSDEEENGEKDVVKAQAPFKGVGGGAEGLSEFEKERLENIRRNREYLQALGLADTRAEIGIAATAARAKLPKPPKGQASKGLKPAKREPREPTRKSRRLEGQTAPHYNEEKLIMEVEAQAEKEQRMDEGPLTLETLNRTEEGGEAFLGLLKELLADKAAAGEGAGTDAAASSSAAASSTAAAAAAMDMDYAARLAALTLDAENDIAKLTPSRVTAMAVHPSERNLVVVAADVDGYFGVWQVDAPASDATGGVYKFRPHIAKVASLQYHPHDPAQLFSASHDGTLRCLDLTKQVFDLLLATGETFEDSGFTCAHMAAHSPHSLFLAGHESSTGLLDLRTRQLAWVNGSAHAKKVNSIEAHPTKEHLFVSSSTDRVVRLWDARKPKKEIWGIPHTNSLNNATFNPTGSHMLVTCQDHNLYLHADPTLAKEPTVKGAQHRIKHNNNTGRWLTKFWPMWDPKHPDSFVVGSLEQPRRIEVYSAQAGFQIANVRSEYMNSVQSVCVFHPTRNVLVGANSSGRTHVFRGP